MYRIPLRTVTLIALLLCSATPRAAVGESSPPHPSEVPTSSAQQAGMNIVDSGYPRLDSAPEDLVPVRRVLTADPPQDPAHPAAIVELTIPSHGERLPAHMYLAAGAGPHPTVLLLHGFPGNEKNLDLAQVMRRLGFNTLFFHYRGAWGATGSYRIAHLVEDTLAVLAYLRDDGHAAALRVDRGALSVLGHSLGGYTALGAGARDPDLRCVMALSPANPAVWKQGLSQERGDVVQRLLPYADSLFMLRDFSGAVLRSELQSLPEQALDTTGMAPGLTGKTVLMLAGVDDEVTPVKTMFDPTVAAFSAQEGLRLEARIIPGDHSFSGSRLTLTWTLMPWVHRHCRAAAGSEPGPSAALGGAAGTAQSNQPKWKKASLLPSRSRA